ncbi:MAG: SusC/RagA family TonB-linked outer membrane protein [Ferruginibacter sp.]
MRKLISTFVVVIALVLSATAQNKTISGRVTDDKGNPLSGVSVTPPNSKVGAQTDKDGNYQINVPSSVSFLRFSYVDFNAEEQRINSGNLNVTLSAANKQLEEVIVVAYGTIKKGDYTGSSAQIDAKDIEKRPLSNALNAIVGSAPGIQTTSASGQPGSAPNIRLRGYGSYSASSSPLYVVDGAVYDLGISNINPDDIETISTLKDASTTALYGSRGANGVIIITTKRGKKNQSNLNFKVTHGFTQRGLPEYSRVDPYQYYPLMWEAYKNTLQYNSAIPAADAAQIASGLFPRYTTGANAGKQNYMGKAYNDISQFLGYNPFNVPSTAVVDVNGQISPNASLLWGDDLDWAGAATKGGQRGDYNLSFSGGADKSDYFGSLNYTNEDGYQINSGLKRYTGRIGVNAQPTKWFKTGFNISGAINTIQSGFTEGGSSIVNPFYFSRYIGPIYPIHAHDPSTGAYLKDNGGQIYYDYGNSGNAARPSLPGRHTIAENLWNVRNVKRNNISARTFADVIFTPYLKFTTNIGADVQDYLYQEYDNKIVGDGSPSGRARRTSTKTTSYTINELLNFNKKFGNHNISALIGHENYSYNRNYQYASKQGQIVDGITELENFSTINSVSSSTDKATIESYLSRVNYDYSGKYFLSASLRRDGNSKFSADQRWANFWSVGGAWRLDKESFLSNVNWVNQLKLRSSYGITGNDGGIGLYPYQALYNLGNNNAGEPGFVQGTLANDSLTWETAKSLDLGVDFSLFKSRVTGSVEYFNRITDGLIFSVPQPLSNGGTADGALSVIKNIGSLYNRGVELQLGVDVVRQKDFNWNINFNWTKFKNQITKMPDGIPEIINGTKKLSVGHSIYDFYLKHYYGVDPADGAALYGNINTYSATTCRLVDNGKGSMDTVTTDQNNAKLVYTGEVSTPDFYGSVTNTFSYKNFQLSVVLTYQVGGKIYDGSYQALMSPGSYGTALSSDILNRWQKPGDITSVPRMDNGKTGIFDATSDRWLVGASYLNVNAISLSYTFPKSFLTRLNGKSASMFVSGENLALFSKRQGLSAGSSFSGTTDNTYNVARVISAGLNFNF